MTTPRRNPRYVAVAEAAAQLGGSVELYRTLLAEGIIEGALISGEWFVDADVLAAALAIRNGSGAALLAQQRGGYATPEVRQARKKARGDTPWDPSVGGGIRRARQRLKMSTADLAEVLDVPEVEIEMIEDGSASVPDAMLVEIATALFTSVAVLTGAKKSPA